MRREWAGAKRGKILAKSSNERQPFVSFFLLLSCGSLRPQSHVCYMLMWASPNRNLCAEHTFMVSDFRPHTYVHTLCESVSMLWIVPFNEAQRKRQQQIDNWTDSRVFFSSKSSKCALRVRQHWGIYLWSGQQMTAARYSNVLSIGSIVSAFWLAFAAVTTF